MAKAKRELTVRLEDCGLTALKLHIQLVAPSGEYKDPAEHEFVISPKDSHFDTNVVRLSQMELEHREHQDIYTMVCLGRRDGHRPKVSVHRIYRNNYISTYTAEV